MKKFKEALKQFPNMTLKEFNDLSLSNKNKDIGAENNYLKLLLKSIFLNKYFYYKDTNYTTYYNIKNFNFVEKNDEEFIIFLHVKTIRFDKRFKYYSVCIQETKIDTYTINKFFRKFKYNKENEKESTYILDNNLKEIDKKTFDDIVLQVNNFDKYL